MAQSSNHIDRRAFAQRMLAGMAGLGIGIPAYGRGPERPGHPGAGGQRVPGMPARETGGGSIRIQNVSSNFEREPLVRPFGFKGGYLTEIWQTAAMMESDSGVRRIGIGTQSVLWSDAKVFAGHSESGGNGIMYNLSERALQMVRGRSFTTPLNLLDDILEEVLDYGKRITGHPNLRTTFALNALVGFDNAAWLLYAAENGITDFDTMIPEAYRAGLSCRHDRVASVPTVAYEIPVSEIGAAADEGSFVIKLKFGQPGTQEEMLEKDMARLTQIHETLKNKRTEHTADGKLAYYLDMNGRYEAKDTLLRLLDHARAIGAFDHIIVVEEPFPEHAHIDVGDIDVLIAADESAHTDEDVLERIEMGYGAIALKAIAKTLSMTMKMAQVAYEHDVPCFCADLTVNPILVEWNKMVAARLAPIPGFEVGLLETNGHQNYANWRTMETYHPCPNASWREVRSGAFHLGENFYETDGCIFEPSAHYEDMFAPDVRP